MTNKASLLMNCNLQSNSPETMLSPRFRSNSPLSSRKLNLNQNQFRNLSQIKMNQYQNMVPSCSYCSRPAHPHSTLCQVHLSQTYRNPNQPPSPPTPFNPSHLHAQTQNTPSNDARLYHWVNNESILSQSCINCKVTETPLWRRDLLGNHLCNACGLYYKTHEAHRPIDWKATTIKRRKRKRPIIEPMADYQRHPTISGASTLVSDLEPLPRFSSPIEPKLQATPLGHPLSLYQMYLGDGRKNARAYLPSISSAIITPTITPQRSPKSTPEDSTIPSLVSCLEGLVSSSEVDTVETNPTYTVTPPSEESFAIGVSLPSFKSFLAGAYLI